MKDLNLGQRATGAECRIGAASSNIPILIRLAGCTPPPKNEIDEPAILSTCREPVRLGTMVGWTNSD